eukprot:31074-Hanusia_phi.AAC.1
MCCHMRRARVRHRWDTAPAQPGASGASGRGRAVTHESRRRDRTGTIRRRAAAGPRQRPATARFRHRQSQVLNLAANRSSPDSVAGPHPIPELNRAARPGRPR